MHKVIEHVHARVCTEFVEWIVKHPNVHHDSITDYYARLKEIYTNIIKPGGVQKDVTSLIEQTLQKVIDEEGGYPEPDYR